MGRIVSKCFLVQCQITLCLFPFPSIMTFLVDILMGEIEVLAQKCAEHGQLPSVQRIFTPIYNIIRDLKGLKEQALAPLDCFMGNVQLRDRAMDKNDHLVSETQLMMDITHSFMLGDMLKTRGFADMFGAVMRRKQVVFTDVIIEFYVGLAACHFAREMSDKTWKAKVEEVLGSLEQFCNHSKWNFENKLLLLRAECHYTSGELSDAAKCYELSISSACNHKLVHEEALTCELAGNFFKEQDDEAKSKMMFARAHKAYMKWGAIKKAKALPQV